MRPKIYIEYDPRDKDVISKLTGRLKAENIETNEFLYNETTYTLSHVKEILKQNDIIIWVLSENIKNIESLSWYFSQIREIEEEENRKLLFLIFIDEMDIPKFILGRERCLISRQSTNTYTNIIDIIKKNAGCRFFNNDFREEKRKEALKELHNKFLQKNITLFCGSGISAGSGIPSWSDLILTLLINNTGFPPSYTDVLYELIKKRILDLSVLARIIKVSDTKIFRKHIQKALYNKKKKDTTSTIDAIINLCTPSTKGGIKSIISYNFDDLLEINFRKRKIPFQVIHQKKTEQKEDCIPIYHVHGYLPQNTSDTTDSPIIFSEDEYHELYNNQYIWNTHIQLNSLRESTCLYVGISFTDPNMRRLADIHIKEHGIRKHFIIKRIPTIDTEINHPYIPLRKIIEQIMFMEEIDAESFGFQIIWIKDFNEIEKIFNTIKK